MAIIIIIILIVFVLSFFNKDLDASSTDEKLIRKKQLEDEISKLKKEQRKMEEIWGKENLKKAVADFENEEFNEDLYENKDDKIIEDEVDPEFMRPSSGADNEEYVSNLKDLIVEDLYIESDGDDYSIHTMPSYGSDIKFNQIKEVTNKVVVQSKIIMPPTKHKVKVHNYILSDYKVNEDDIKLFNKYFDFERIQYSTDLGSIDIIFNENQEISYSGTLNVCNDDDYLKLLEEVDKNGTLNFSLTVEVGLEQNPCLQSLYGIKKIDGSVSIYNPFFSDMGDVESVKTLSISNFKNQPPIDLKNLKYIESSQQYGGLALYGNIKSFGKLEVINGDLDLTKCDYNSYDNIKEIKGDLHIKHKYKGLYKKPNVEGLTYHKRTNNLKKSIENGWSESSDAAHKRRENFSEIKASFDKTYKFIVEKEFSKAYNEFKKIKYPDNLTFKKRNAYKDYDKGIRNPKILRYDGYEIWLLYFYNKNVLNIDSDFLFKLCGFSRLITEIGKAIHIEGLMPFLEDEIKNNTPYDLNTIEFNWVEDYFITISRTETIKNSPYHINPSYGSGGFSI